MSINDMLKEGDARRAGVWPHDACSYRCLHCGATNHIEKGFQYVYQCEECRLENILHTESIPVNPQQAMQDKLEDILPENKKSLKAMEDAVLQMDPWTAERFVAELKRKRK